MNLSAIEHTFIFSWVSLTILLLPLSLRKSSSTFRSNRNMEPPENRKAISVKIKRKKRKNACAYIDMQNIKFLFIQDIFLGKSLVQKPVSSHAQITISIPNIFPLGSFTQSGSQPNQTDLEMNNWRGFFLLLHVAILMINIVRFLHRNFLGSTTKTVRKKYRCWVWEE